MLVINKITPDYTVDFAAEELKKYIRMMMPEGGDVQISYNPKAKDGFLVGLMQDFGLDVSDVEDTELDDIIYINCDTEGGIIAGDNPRSVLLAVYEYLRRNGCRWLFPGVDGEYIPMKSISSVKYRHKPSMRYRGQCMEGCRYQQQQIDVIDFLPKIGMNVFMIQLDAPDYTFYHHTTNTENLTPEPLSETQRIVWKRQLECEIAKRSLQFHDIGHGFTVVPFGIYGYKKTKDENIDALLTDEQRELLAEIDGWRGHHQNHHPMWTNFCMSNPKARRMVAEYIRDFSKNHSNIDYLHVWLADGMNNHCECSECQKKTPSDFYIMLMNEIDELLIEEGLNTRIVFICYVDTFWAPLVERVNNPSRFALLFAPITRSYAYSLPDGRGKTKLMPYKRNKNQFPSDLATSFDYLDDWKKCYDGPIIAFEYHFWRHYNYSLSGLMQARLLYDDVHVYKNEDFDGIIACGSQRSLFPNALRLYTFARAMYDFNLGYEEIEEDYMKHAYGDAWQDIRSYLAKIEDALPFDFFSRDEARGRENGHYNPDMAKKIETIRDITKDGMAIITANYNMEYRVQTVAVRLLEKHAYFCDLISDWMAAKARGELESAQKLLDYARVEFGKYESEIKQYFDHGQYFLEYGHCQNTKSKSNNNVLAI